MSFHFDITSSPKFHFEISNRKKKFLHSFLRKTLSVFLITLFLIPNSLFILPPRLVEAQAVSPTGASPKSSYIPVPIEQTPSWLTNTLQSISGHEKELGLKKAEGATLEGGEGSIAFTSESTLNNELKSNALPEGDLHNVKNDTLKVRTLFDTTSDTVHKKVLIQSGSLQTEFSATLENNGVPFSQKAYSTPEGDVYTYQRDNETFLYSQVIDSDNTVSLKEWVRVDKALENTPLNYTWIFQGSTSTQPISFESNQDHSVTVFQDMTISGIDEGDTDRQKHVMDAVTKLLAGKASVDAHKEIAHLAPPIYFTKQGEKKIGAWIVADNKLTLSIDEPTSSYPLLIDPTFTWGQWFGGNAGAVIYDIAVSGNNIYAGGNSTSASGFETVTFYGTQSGGSGEGLVIKMVDNGNTTSLVWAQWLGGTGQDYVLSLAVNGDSIYVGGNTNNGALAWDETITFQGTGSGSEGFVVKIADGAVPTLAWGQWVGGSAGGQGDQIYAIAVDGSSIYVAGSSSADTAWEAFTFQGTNDNAASEAYVVKIIDGVTPTLGWGQWLGGSSIDSARRISVTSNGIYVAGNSNSDASWETVTFQGTHSGSTEVFVVKITDGATPTLVWGQWLGGSSTDNISGLGVNGNNIFVAGTTYSSTSFESVTFQGVFTGGAGSGDGFVIKITDGATPTLVWGQWVGNVNNYDFLGGLVVSGNNIYVAGHSNGGTRWGPAYFFKKTVRDLNAYGFVFKITDGATPDLAWAEWLGGNGAGDDTKALAVRGNKIYAGGTGYNDNAWLPLVLQGSYTSSDGFVAKITEDRQVLTKPGSNLGLVGYWSMNEGTSTVATDFSGNRNHGTLNGNSAWVSGKTGKALTFDGTGDFVDTGTNNISGTQAFTLTAWMNTNLVSRYSGAISIGTSAADESAYIGTCGSSGGITGTPSSIGGGFYGNNFCSGITTLNKWVHVAMTFAGGSGGAVRIYVDGIDRVGGTATPNIGATNRKIGRIGSDTIYDFDGEVDEVRLYNRALTATEIAKLYAGGQVYTNASQNNKMTSGLIGLWSMNGQDIIWGSNFMRDGSGNGNNGTLTNLSKNGSIDFGVSGQALKFNGTSSYIDMGNASALNMGTSDWTTSAWVKTNDVSTQPMIISKMEFVGGAIDAWFMSVSSAGHVGGGIFKTSRSILTTTDDGTAVNDNEWHHIAVTWTRTGNILRYVDGVLTGTAKDISSEVGQNISNSRIAEVGARDGGTGNELFFKGLIDEARVYNRALSAAEIKQLYRMGSRH